MKKIRPIVIGEIKESEGAMAQRDNLWDVHSSLEDHKEPEYLVETIAIAITDITQHICPDIEKAFDTGR